VLLHLCQHQKGLARVGAARRLASDALRKLGSTMGKLERAPGVTGSGVRARARQHRGQRRVGVSS
jgi:hypothetical protein